MSARGRRRSHELRSTLDRILLHDVRNMSFRLRMLLDNLEEYYGDPDFKRSVRDLLAATVERLEGIAGRFQAHEDAVLVKILLDANEVLRGVAGAATAGRSRRRAPTALPSLALALGELPEIWADPDYLRDAFASLLDNALEAAGPRGRVLVRSFASHARGRPRATVDFIDNGQGMSPEFVQDRLTSPYGTTKQDGVGLGLYTATRIVKYHRGTVRILSAPGGGTVVRLTFPAATPAAP
jgi:signal transduction histidine kinase